MTPPAINSESLSDDALLILRNIRENARLGRSNKLADVKAALEPSVVLDFDTYFFFLRKFHYIGLDREAQLKLTSSAEDMLEGKNASKFTGEVEEFFVEYLNQETTQIKPAPTAPEGRSRSKSEPPPPPTEADALDAALENSSPVTRCREL